MNNALKGDDNSLKYKYSQISKGITMVTDLLKTDYWHRGYIKKLVKMKQAKKIIYTTFVLSKKMDFI